jgi:N-acetylmuramoyl-L-alanine amidase
MITGRTSFLRALCVALAFALVVPFARTASANADWQVIKVGRWDYLAIDNIAKFYSLGGDLTPVDKVIRVENAINSLEIRLDSREAIVNGVRTWFSFPVIAHTDGRYLISRIDLAKTIEPQFRPQMIAGMRPFKTVVLDPGHGGVEKGATNIHGMEKDFALDVALQLKPMLEARGLRVVMTRETDVQVPLHDRARIANGTKDCIFVSIHFNATSNPLAAGFEIYSLTPRGAPSTNDNHLAAKFANMQAGSPVDAQSFGLSMAVYHAMLGHVPQFDRGIKRARFAVLRLTQVPAILVEGGFVSEREEARLIANKQWRGKLAQSIAVGIENYKRLTEKKQRPMLLADYRRQFDGVLVARNADSPTLLRNAISTIFPARNQQPGASTANIQVTTPPGGKPAGDLATTAPPAVTAAVRTSSADAPTHEDEEGHETTYGDASWTAEDTQPPPAAQQPPTPAATVAADQSVQEAPPILEQQPSPADAAALSPPTVESAPIPAGTPEPPPSAAQRVLKLLPPPKFRQ